MLFRAVATLIGLTPWFVRGQPGNIAGLHQLDRRECTVVGNGNLVCSSDGALYSKVSSHDEVAVAIEKLDEEEDPMLEKMPGFDFKAYKRADISSFYNEPPGSRTEVAPAFNGQAGKFQNMANERLDLYWCVCVPLLFHRTRISSLLKLLFILTFMLIS
jgi:hypothetical protein